MTKRELLIACVAAAMLALVIVGLRVKSVDRQRGDTALFMQLAENIGQRGQPVSQVFANTQAFLEGKNLRDPVSRVAAGRLAPPAVDERNMLSFHAYWILFLTGILARFFPSDIVTFAQMTVSFIGLGLFSYILLRRAGVSSIAAAAFCFLVISHPAWAQSLLHGQPYPDRLFLLAGFAFMYLITRPVGSRGLLLASGALCALINERAALVAGEFLLMHTVLFWRQQPQERAFRLGLGGSLLAFGIVVVKLVLNNGEYVSFLPGTLGQLLLNFSLPGFLANAELFALVNLPFLILAFFEWRTAVIALVLMLPNVVGNIGGAEKIGWATSYHSYYQPALILAALLGCVRLYRLAERRERRWMVAPAICVSAAYLAMLSPVNTAPVQFGTTYMRYHFIPTLRADYSTYSGPWGQAVASLVDRLRSAVPEHAVVTMGEAGMPILYRRDRIRVFPTDIDRADYALMSYEEIGRHTRYFGAVTFNGPEQQKLLDALILKRMQTHGYDFNHAQKFPGLGLALIKRTTARPGSAMVAPLAHS